MKNKKALVVGQRVSQSLSPTIFKYWFKKYKTLGEYSFKNIKEKEFHYQIKTILKDKSLCGINITIPFKEKIMKHLDFIDNNAKKIGAVNCVTIKKNKLYGSNTDWVGYLNLIKSNILKKNRIKKEAIVLGYGGVGKAVVFALLKLEYKKIHVFNRTTKKLKTLNNKRIKTYPLSKINAQIKNSNLIVNTIPINILKANNVPKKLPPNVIISDVIYRPLNTGFLNYFINPKLKLYGISMLINQAAPCFNLWYGIKPKIDKGVLVNTKKQLLK
tara:strand:- start:1322 stop:2137 length:816 start_codon:yes stop_codon:yes gene_type:complete